MYRQYKVSPIIVTFATKTTPIHKIPFPAVTICPESIAVSDKLNFSKLENEFWSDGNLTRDERNLYEYASQICESVLATTFSKTNTIENATDFYQTLHEVS